jgi:TP901 family phage tail tape measure protein
MASVTTKLIKFIGDASGMVNAVRQGAASLDQLGQKMRSVSAAGAGLGAVGSAIQRPMQSFKEFGSSAQSAFKKVQNAASGLASRVQASFGGLRQSVQHLNYMVFGLSNAFRHLSLGITNLGRVISWFVSLPLGIFMRQGLKTAMDFESAMVRVRKTTNMTREQMGYLTEKLRDLAKISISSHTELAEMAEQIGRLGVGAGFENQIAKLTQIFDQLASATTITASTVAESMGRIGNAFGWDLRTDEGVENIERLANTINRLENETASSADQIVKAIYKYAPIAKTLGISAQHASALSASLISMGYSSEEAGTALRNMGIYLLRNHDILQKLLGGMEKYNTMAKLKTAINEDALAVILDLLRASREEADLVDRVVNQYDVAKIRGGKAVTSLAENLEYLQQALRVADDEWEGGSSLIREYSQVMETTAAQASVLRNNLNDVAITIGNAVLPVLNRIIQTAIPGIRMLAKAFEELPYHLKLTYVGIAALLVVMGPLMAIVGQAVYAFSLFFMGISGILRIIPQLIKLFIMLALQVGWPLLKRFAGVPMAIAVALTGVLKVLSKLGVDVASFFTNLANSAYTWGENLAGNLSSGLMAGAVRLVSRAVTFVANMIARFLQSHSPPKEGPLSHIDKWGKALIDTYLQGFLDADFQILRHVGQNIQKVLESLVAVGKVDEITQFEFLLEAREHLANLISEFNRTGKVAVDVMDKITKNLGSAAGEIQTLIRHWLEYHRVQRLLVDLETRRKNALKTFDDEIKRIGKSNASAEEKVALIRQAMRARHQELLLLDEEKDLLEEQEEQAKSNLDWQKEFIGALQDQDSIQVRMIEAMEKMASAASKLSGALGGEGYSFPDPGDDDPFGNIDWQGLSDGLEPLFSLPERLRQGAFALQGLFDGLAGKSGLEDKPLSWIENLDPDMLEMYGILYNAGDKVREFKETVQGYLDEVSGFFSGLVETVNSDLGVFGETWDGFGEEIKRIWDKVADYIRGDLDFSDLEEGSFLEAFVIGFLLPIQSALAPLPGLIERFNEAWSEFTERVGPQVSEVWEKIADVLSRIDWERVFNWIGLAAGAILGLPIMFLIGFVDLLVLLATFAVEASNAIAEFGDNAKEWFGSLPEKINQFFDDFYQSGNDLIENFFNGLFENMAILWEDVMESFRNAPAEINQFFDDFYATGEDLMEGLIGGIVDKVGDLLEALSGVASDALSWVKGLFGISSPSTIMEGYGGDFVQGFINGMIGKGADLLQGIGETFGGVVEDVVTAISDIVPTTDEMVRKATDGWETLKNDVSAKAGNARDAVIEAWGKLTGTTTGDTETAVTDINRLWRDIEAVSTYADDVSGDTIGYWEDMATDILTETDDLVTDVLKAFGKLETDLIGLVKGITGDIVPPWETARTDIVSEAETIYNEVTAKFDDLLVYLDNQKGDWYNAGVAVVQGFIDGINVKAAKIREEVADALNAGIAYVEARLDLGSPSKLMKSFGMDTMQGYIDGILAMERQLRQAFGGIMDRSGIFDQDQFRFTGMGTLGVPSVAGLGGGNVQMVELHIHDPIIREDRDLEQLAKKVKKEMDKQHDRARRFGGR